MAELRESIETLIHQAPGVALAWIVFLGGCIGSFLNVVVYRLPAGQSLLHPGSHCPRCQHPIRWYDNLPVLGWVHLRGRCRDCQGRISARYPLVEALLMFLFANQWIQDVQGVPQGAALGPAGFAFVWHVSLLSVLVCAALIDFDGHDPPVSLIIFGAAVPLVLTGVSPPEALRVLGGEDATGAWLTMLGGGILAGLIRLILAPGLRRHPAAAADGTPRRPGTALALAAMTGLYLGPQRAVTTLLLTMLLWHLMRRIYARRGGGAPWSWYLAALAWVTVTFQP